MAINNIKDRNSQENRKISILIEKQKNESVLKSK